ncbi:MAG: hypothetical protein JWO31_1249 [Phycisphaerales bacterium]|nr:hypothetical protein [Phycisphaerales bacterium]
MRKLFHHHGLSIVMAALFLVCWAAQMVTGHRVYNDEQREHRQPTIGLLAYLSTGHFLEATGENWESEFLQMSAFVWLTSCLFQKGSPESKNPDDPSIDEPPVTPRSPWPVRRGGWYAAVYARSLSLALFGMFLCAFALHAAGGAWSYSHQQELQGEPPVTVLEYLGTAQFWFESFENWQSEFLSIGVMVVLGIFLRQKGSPESKPVNTPHSENE